MSWSEMLKTSKGRYASKTSIISNALRAQPSLKVKVFYLGVASLSLSFLDTLESHQGDFDRGLSGQRSLSERDINDICKFTTNSFLRLYIKYNITSTL